MVVVQKVSYQKRETQTALFQMVWNNNLKNENENEYVLKKVHAVNIQNII